MTQWPQESLSIWNTLRSSCWRLVNDPMASRNICQTGTPSQDTAFGGWSMTQWPLESLSNWNTHPGPAVGGWPMTQWPQESLSNWNTQLRFSCWRLVNDPMASGISVKLEHSPRFSCWRLVNDPMASGISVKLEHPVRSSCWRLVNDPMASGIFVNWNIRLQVQLLEVGQ